MGAFLLKRLGVFLATLWAALTMNFFLPRLMPGNPALAMMARYRGRVNGTVLHVLEVQFGVITNKSLIVQYIDYLSDVARGQFGISLTYFPDPVSRVIRDGIPWTLGLVGMSTVIAFCLGTVVGILSAWRRNGKLDSLLPPLFVVLGAFPYFWVALVAIYVFSLVLGWLPFSFGYDLAGGTHFSLTFVMSVLQHAVLPALTLTITSIGGWALTMRNNMVNVLMEDYVRTAKAKGLSPVRVIVDYAARNAILPNLAGFAMSLGFVLSGAVLVEFVFAYPGVGYLLLQAVESEDFPLMQGLFLLITVAVLVCVFAADVLTAVLDPRARVAERR